MHSTVRSAIVVLRIDHKPSPDRMWCVTDGHEWPCPTEIVTREAEARND